MTETCGLTYGTQFAYYDRVYQSLKTLQPTLEGVSDQFFGTVPKRGGMCGGKLFALQTRERPTNASGYFSLLPTPVARDYKGIAFKPQDLSRLVNALIWLSENQISDGKNTVTR